MSLDVYLQVGTPMRREAGSGIFIRENGQTKEISREDWDRRNPGREPVTVQEPEESRSVYHSNITHNLNMMADAAGIYKHLWRPEEVGVKKASDLIGPLSDGLGALKADPEKFKKFNPANGWGDYDGLVQFVESYLKACIENPDATIRVSR